LSIRCRVTRIFQVRRNARSQPADPLQAVEDAYADQLQLLDQARRGAADIAAHRRRLEIHLRRTSAEEAELEAQAEREVEAGRDDVARALLLRQAAARRRRAALSDQHQALTERELVLDEAVFELHSRIFDYRLRVQELKANHSAAQAELGMQEARRGIGRGEAEAALRQAATEIRQLEARAAALRELADGPLGPGRDEIEEAFDQLEAAAQAERRLDGIKTRLRLAPQEKPGTGSWEA
jgi:phage shock protein A